MAFDWLQVRITQPWMDDIWSMDRSVGSSQSGQDLVLGWGQTDEIPDELEVAHPRDSRRPPVDSNPIEDLETAAKSTSELAHVAADWHAVRHGV